MTGAVIPRAAMFQKQAMETKKPVPAYSEDQQKLLFSKENNPLHNTPQKGV